MRRLLGPALFLAAGFLLAVPPRSDGREGPTGPDVPAHQDREAAADRKEIRVAAGETRSSAINAFNARLEINGKLDESVFLLGGSLRLEGEVTGDVICIAAQVDIGEQAVIGRDLIVIGGQLRKAEPSRVGGEVYNIRTREDLKKIARSLLPFIPELQGVTFFKVIKIFFWLVLSLLALAVFPTALGQAASTLAEAPLAHLWRGVLTLLAFLLLLFVFLLLSFVLIGIPLLIVLMATYFLLLVFGRAAVFYFIGERISRSLKLKANAMRFIVLGIALYALLKFVPYAGALLLVLIDLFALGVGVGYFLRRRKAET
jgi:hypothetical protein